MRVLLYISAGLVWVFGAIVVTLMIFPIGFAMDLTVFWYDKEWVSISPVKEYFSGYWNYLIKQND